jgi:hypothetical protein
MVRDLYRFSLASRVDRSGEAQRCMTRFTQPVSTVAGRARALHDGRCGPIAALAVARCATQAQFLDDKQAMAMRTGVTGDNSR